MKPKQNLRMSLLLMMAALMSLVAQAEVRASSTSPPESQRYSFTTAKADDATVVRFVLPGFDRQVVDSATVTERVSVPGLASTAFAGLPALPYKTFKIAPEYSSTPQIVIRDSTYVDYDINLAHNPSVEYDSLGIPHYNDIPCTMYQGFMPSEIARVTDTQIYRGRPIYTITIMPMKYDRALGRLRVFSSLDIDVVYTPGISTQSTTANRSAAFNSYTNRTLSSILGDDYVTNPITESSDDVATYSLNSSDLIIHFRDETEDYLIVTYGKDFDQAIDSLREWKKNIGYRVHSVGDYNWTSKKIDDTIKHFYNTLPNLTTVLLLGTHGAVPGQMLHNLNVPQTDYGAEDSPIDFFYMCMDGADDKMPDVAYGRIPAACQQHANEAIAKIIKYEQGLFDDPSAYDRAFVAGEYGYDTRSHTKGTDRFIPTLEEVRDILQSSNITTKRIYNSNYDPYPSVWYPYFVSRSTGSKVSLPTYLQKPNFMWDGTQQTIIDTFNQGVNLGVYNGHGSMNGWNEYTFDIYACQHLNFTNSAPLVFSISCSTANHKYPNCLIAELSRRSSGAIAAIASSNLTYLGYSDAFLLGLTDAIWPNKYTFNGWSESNRTPIYRLYDIMNAAHTRLEETQGGGYWDYPGVVGYPYCDEFIYYQHVNFHVYGDPSLNYNAYCPTEFKTVNYSIKDNRSLTIRLSTDDLPAKAVVKNLTTGDIETHTYNSDADFRKNFLIDNPDNYQMIISGPNRIPRKELIINRQPYAGYGHIDNVYYDKASQKIEISFTIPDSMPKPPSFTIRDLNNTRYDVVQGPITSRSKRILEVGSLPRGIYVIEMYWGSFLLDRYKILL